ncbi:hypothetical protein BsWGS_13817 [Bradybaena similaris]
MLFSATISCQTDECTKALQHCVRDFMDKILQLEQQNNSQLICQDLQILTKCAFNQTCKIPEERRRPFIENVQKEMRTLKFDCDLGIDVDSNTGRTDYLNERGTFSTLGPWNSDQYQLKEAVDSAQKKKTRVIYNAENINKASLFILFITRMIVLCL